TGIPFCYLLLRSVQNPAWCILYIRQVKTLIKSGPPILYQVLWPMQITPHSITGSNHSNE
ncbi:hypothetical protein EOL07_26330, partial [Citrobacter freundii]